MRKFISNNKLAVAFFIISIVGITLDLINRFWGNNPILSHLPEWFVFLLENLSYGVFVSVIVWFIFSYRHERKRKIIYKRRLSIVYDSFKEQLITQLLFACYGGCDSNLAEKLSDHNNFRKFFEENDREKWYFVANQLDNPKHSFREDIMNEFAILEKEISNIINANIFLDEEAYNWLNDISSAITSRRLEYDYMVREKRDFHEFDKPLMRDIWSILTRWNFIDGQLEKDLMKENIEKYLTA